MDYEKLASSAKEQGLIKGIVAERFKFTDKGMKVVGKMLSLTTKQSDTDGKDYIMYTMDTTKGLVQFSLNRSTDDLFKALDPVDKIYEIIYNGKIKTNKGRQCNDYIINEISTDLR